MAFRAFNPEQDREAVHRIWHEINWARSDEDAEMMELLTSEGRTLVADVNGAAECMAGSVPGTIRYLDEDVELSVVMAVTTSRIARKQGLAQRLTAELVAQDAAAGAKVSALGIFEQGFYDRLGFGSGGYEHWLSFDPATIKTRVKARVPRRLTKDDWQAIHRAMLARLRGHGACNLLPPTVTQSQLARTKDGFGLGYQSEGPDGELTHFLWGSATGGVGPYTVYATVYHTRDEFLELMSLLRGLGDQVRLVRMREPAGIQLQDLLVQPFRYRQLTEKSRFESRALAMAYWQLRICDPEGCLARTHLNVRETVRFNLELRDPISAHLSPEAPWQGVGGSYVVTLGPTSSAERGTDRSLATLEASVGAFSRLWLGVRSATGLAVTDELSGPYSLLSALDDTLCLPEARPDWDF